MESDVTSVSLSQVIPIIVVLASGLCMAIFIGIIERLLLCKAPRCQLRGTEMLKTHDFTLRNKHSHAETSKA